MPGCAWLAALTVGAPGPALMDLALAWALAWATEKPLWQRVKVLCDLPRCGVPLRSGPAAWAAYAGSTGGTADKDGRVSGPTT